MCTRSLSFRQRLSLLPLVSLSGHAFVPYSLFVCGSRLSSAVLIAGG